jgi:hypothetical protein
VIPPESLRFCGAVAVALLVWAPLTACTVNDGSRTTGGARSGFDVPVDPYPPFPYASALQRRTIRDYLACASRLSVDLQGPYADSSGEGVLFRLAPGGNSSPKARARVNRRCPQGAVGTALTPPPHAAGHAKAFKRVLRRFARCLSEQGLHLPGLTFGTPDPWHGLKWPFDWHAPGVVQAARHCVDPVRDYNLLGT